MRWCIALCALLSWIVFMSTDAVASPEWNSHDYSGAACDRGYGDVCQYNSTTHIWTCDRVRINGSTSNSVGIKVVYDHSVGGDICDGDDYCAFGHDGSNYFYCKLTESGLDEVVVVGSSSGDSIYFLHDQDTVHYDLREHDASNFHGEVQAGGGSDYIEGSDRDSAFYSETLRGEDGGDQGIYGNAGDDYIYGGPGEDHLWGGVGDDRIYGEGDDDEINGDGGDDLIYGGAGNDSIAGSGGNDSIYADSGQDDVCGDDDDDVLDGGGDGDRIVGGADDDLADGGPGTDTCDMTTETVTSCTPDAGLDRADTTCPPDSGDGG